jgi:hypothetical protein
VTITKYYALTAYLQTRSVDVKEVTLTFAMLEDPHVVGIDLPGSARVYRHWWGNQSQPDARHCAAWIDAGWYVTDVDLPNEWVIFRREHQANIQA